MVRLTQVSHIWLRAHVLAQSFPLSVYLYFALSLPPPQTSYFLFLKEEPVPLSTFSKRDERGDLQGIKWCYSQEDNYLIMRRTCVNALRKGRVLLYISWLNFNSQAINLNSSSFELQCAFCLYLKKTPSFSCCCRESSITWYIMKILILNINHRAQIILFNRYNNHIQKQHFPV